MARVVSLKRRARARIRAEKIAFNEAVRADQKLWMAVDVSNRRRRALRRKLERRFANRNANPS
jgi:hypothetical protein